MNFFGKIFKGAKAVLSIGSTPLGQVGLNAVFPGLGAIVGRVSSAIVNIEAAHAQAGKEHSGPEKLSFVKTDFAESLGVAREVARMRGKDLQYDEMLLKKMIDAQVAAFNAGQELMASFKEVDLVEEKQNG